MNELPIRYNPKECEDKWYKFWEEKDLFSAKPNPDKNPFCIVIPPPNVTGILHMGHALNNSIQDILIRYHCMKNQESLWMPGTDHAGIATQNVVEKTLAKEGIRRQDLGREKFIQRVWQWKEQYGSTIIHQLKKLGASCDWDRARFTMDEEYSQAVLEVFVRLYEKGLIYQGSYIINWCPRCQTALSDEEAPHRELEGNLYYLRYPLNEEIRNSKSEIRNKSKTRNSNFLNYIVVATTRPETMLGDTAVAVNPKDKRYKELIGKSLVLPLVNREIQIIADSMVDMHFGTGAVKVTPAHDPNDYLLGKKHNLEFVNILRPDGCLNENAGDYQGMDRFEAREVILEDLKEKGLLEKIKPHSLSAGHCYRCHTIIEPYLSKQWFVRMKPLAKPAIEAVKKGKIKFYPKRWTKVYLNWMENIQDWCISRQIWWGHRIPVYYCKKCQETECHESKIESGVIVSRIQPRNCPVCGSEEICQDDDVLDTWFSSWLWPFATFYWPFTYCAEDRHLAINNRQKDLAYFYPTSVLVTAPEIIFFWVARMIMAGLEFMQDVPFRDVYIHGTVRDIEGKKMSKSLGNIIDPLEIIEEYGADALRFSLISITAQGQDVFLSKEKFEQGRNFANKIWNASRFILMNLARDQNNQGLCQSVEQESLSLVNRWILSRFYSTLKELNQNLESYRFNEAANLLYGFFWHEFCDWYLESIKPILLDKAQQAEYIKSQTVMYKMLENSLRILHPFMPFITEEVWQRLNHQGSSIMRQAWPHTQEELIDKKVEGQADTIFNLVTEIRNLRSWLKINPEQKVKLMLFAHTKSKEKLILDNYRLITHLAMLENIEILKVNKKPHSAISAITEDIDIYVPVSGLIDIEAETKKLGEKINAAKNLILSKETRLKNKEFSRKAPAEIIEKEKDSLLKLKDELRRMERMVDELH